MGVKNPAGERWRERTGDERRSWIRRLAESDHPVCKILDKVRQRFEDCLRRALYLGEDDDGLSASVRAGIRRRVEGVMSGDRIGFDGRVRKAVFSADARSVIAEEFGEILAQDGVVTVHDREEDAYGRAFGTRNPDDRRWEVADVPEGARIVVRRGPFVTIPKTPVDPREVLERADAGNLKFEFTPARTMAAAGFSDGKWSDVDYIPTGSIEIDPTSDRYGQAIFGGNRALRMKDGRVALFRPDFHAARFNNNARALCMPGVGHEGRMLEDNEDIDNWPEVSPDELIEAYKNVARANIDYIPETGKGSLYLAPGLRAVGDQIGVKPNSRYAFTCLGIPAGKIFGRPAALWIEDQFHRATVGGLGNRKAAGNYVPTYWVKHQKHLLGYDDVAYLDNNNEEFRELSSSNLFFITKERVLVTPNLSGEILNGCTRDSILTIAQELLEQGVITGIEERVVTPEELPNMVEAFSSGTGVTINGVEVFKGNPDVVGDGVKVDKDGLPEFQMDVSCGGMGPVTGVIYDKFNRILAGEEMENPRYKDWMVPLDEEPMAKKM